MTPGDLTPRNREGIQDGGGPLSEFVPQGVELIVQEALELEYGDFIGQGHEGGRRLGYRSRCTV